MESDQTCLASRDAMLRIARCVRKVGVLVPLGRMRFRRIVVLGGLLLAAGAGLGDDGVRPGPAAYGDWRTDAPGVRPPHFSPADLAAPYKTQSAANPSRHAPRAPSALPKTPAGFLVDLFADGLSGPRVVRTAPNGDVFVAESSAGRVRVLRADANELGARAVPDLRRRFTKPVRNCFFPVWPRPALGLCRDNRLGDPLPLSQRRSGSDRRA